MKAITPNPMLSNQSPIPKRTWENPECTMLGSGGSESGKGAEPEFYSNEGGSSVCMLHGTDVYSQIVIGVANRYANSGDCPVPVS